MIRAATARAARTAAVLAFLAAALAAPPVVAGRLVAVDGQNLYVETLGEAGPVVVFESGLGADLHVWRSVAAPVSRFARVVLYDRAGLGRSLPLASDRPVTADDVVRRLRALLREVGLRPPYVLVGHSLGGLYVQAFARAHPAEVAGVVLVDAASPEAPPQLTTRATLEPGTAEYLEEAGAADSARQTLAAGPFPDVPLAVLAATDHGPYFAAWEPTLMRLQQDLAALSPRGTLTVVWGSGHDVQLDRPQAVIEAIRAVAAEGDAP